MVVTNLAARRMGVGARRERRREDQNGGGPMRAQTRDQAWASRRLRYTDGPGSSTLCTLGRADFAGDPASVSVARAWAHGLLSGYVADQVREDAVLLVSELVTNAVVHSDSGRRPGGLVTVFLATGNGVAHCEVIDDGSATSVPLVRTVSQECCSGRGLRMVDVMADAWGVHHDDEAGNAVWFRICGPIPEAASSPGQRWWGARDSNPEPTD
ncbi:ATP-binding protein [Microbispora amethystogenes]|uniref:ATP-binding protein n=1 Tax=Microbispora amethystogenes TaxID=1427754 RepID=UPI00340C7841